MVLRTVIIGIWIVLPVWGSSRITSDTVRVETDTVKKAPQVDEKDVKLFIDKIEIEGKLERPQVMLFLPSRTPEIDDIRIERSFMKEIFRPVDIHQTLETKYKANVKK